MTHYDTLGVARDASAAAIKAAYLAKARIHHPDFHTDEAPASRRRHGEQMQAINEAWRVLGDPVARAAHDVAIDDGPNAGSRQATGPSGRGPRVPPGKSWTPRADDTAWMDDFETWRNEDARLVDDEPSPAHRAVATVPALLLAAAIVSALLGIVLEARPLLALAFIGVFLAAGLFVFLPLIEMAKGRDDEP